MSWFKRVKDGIITATKDKKETPDGLWVKCERCKHRMTNKDFQENSYVCDQCFYHHRIGSKEYFELLLDAGTFVELNGNLVAEDPLEFVDKRPYPERLKNAYVKTGLKDAVRTGTGKMNGNKVAICCMDFGFIGGSMGAVVGEKIARTIDEAIRLKLPLIIISKSGGARMMEAALSLMQMAKTSAKLAQLDRAGLPYISVLTDPTTGGVTASYAMLGDFNIAEPEALIGFAGPRVIKEAIGKDLPEGFQSSEFLLEQGFLDFIVERQQLKEKVVALIELIKNTQKVKPAQKADPEPAEA